MGIYDRDYERSYDTGSGWRDGGGYGGGVAGGMGGWSANGKLLATLGAVYVLQFVFEPWFSDLFSLRGDWFTEPWRVFELVTYGFLHSTEDIFHLLFNGVALFFFGRVIEARYGSREYVAFFLAAVVVAGLAWTLTEVAATGGLGVTLVGASGGIAAIIVMFALLYPNQQVLIWGVLPVPAWLLAVLFLGNDILGALGRSGNVAYTAHLGGALFGFLYYRNGWRLAGWLPGAGGFKMPSLKRRPKLKVHVADDVEESEDDRLDKILEKIQRSGQDSLSRDEQRYLEEASRKAQQRRRG